MRAALFVPFTPFTALAVAFAFAASAACTLIADFTPKPAPVCDGGDAVACDAARDSDLADAMPPASDAGLDDGAAPDDASPPVNDLACQGLPSGHYCGNDGLHGYGGPATDLVQCEAGAIAHVQPCDAGCLAMPNPFPDACNVCDQKPNGTYCGRDFIGFPAENADFLLQCQQTNAVQIVACAHGCSSQGKASSCFP